MRLGPEFVLPQPLFKDDRPGGGGGDEAKTTAGVTAGEAGKAYDDAQRPFAMVIKDGEITVTEKATPAGEKDI